METTTSFGFWVRRQRKALDLTQQVLADRVGCSLAEIKKIESDERRPSRQIAERLADILGVPASQREVFLEAARGLRPVDQLPLAHEAAIPTPVQSSLVTSKEVSSIPSGTVTFLFTDIEDSTKLWEQYPQEMLVAHARHNQILREAIESNNGYVFQLIGDAFCAAFHTAGDAIRAAVKCQREVQAEPWEIAQIKVRMGIHTGKAEFQASDGSYVGYMTLSRVQRLMSAGCGGQVLVSFATQELVHDDLPKDIRLQDMGKWRLKNLSRPEHIFQLIIPGLLCDFPSLKIYRTKDSSMDTIRLLIADDHALFREGLRALFAALPDIEVIGEAPDGATAITQVDSLHPDVVLMDINMPGINGIEATRRILSTHSNLGIIMVTMLEDDASVFSAMRAGARGYVLKGAHHEEILQAIRTVATGQAVFGPGIATRMMNFFQGLNTAPQKGGSATVFPELTEREREVLTLIAKGVSNKEIADRLVISAKTVSNHITNIFSKLQVADRAQAILRARDAGLG